MRFAHAQATLREAVASGASPAVVVEVGTRSGPVWQEAHGTLTYEPDAPPARVDTIFDLASLTKPIVTATLAMKAVESGRLALDDRIGRWLPAWRGVDRETATVADLLEHAAGLTAYLPLYQTCTGRTEFEHAICELPLECAPRRRSIYGDLGFMLLGFVLEDASGCSLDDQFAPLARTLSDEPLTYLPSRDDLPRVAPTEIDSWRGRLLVGDVHDENAWALGGVAGHAGLFGTVGAVGAFARLVLRTLATDTALVRRATLARFLQKSRVPGSSRALGWDTMLPTSSCGRRFSPRSFGHTGFTGTSLWIDSEREMYVALLANRVHPTRDNETFKALRPRIHDEIVEAWHP